MKRAAELDEIRAAAKTRQLQYLNERYGKRYQMASSTQDTISTASSTQDPIETASQTQDLSSKASQTQDPTEMGSQTQDPISTDSTEDSISQLHIPFYVAYANSLLEERQKDSK